MAAPLFLGNSHAAQIKSQVYRIPCFFFSLLIYLFRSKLQLYAEDPNKDVLRWSLTWGIPIFVVHIPMQFIPTRLFE